VGIALSELAQTDQFEQVVDLRVFAAGQAERDVSGHGEMREQRALLGDVADPAVLGRDRPPAVVDDTITDPQSAAVELLKARDQPQERRLAAARGAQDGGDRANRDRQVHTRQDGRLAEPLGR
jgi:hypothetical protein